MPAWASWSLGSLLPGAVLALLVIIQYSCPFLIFCCETFRNGWKVHPNFLRVFFYEYPTNFFLAIESQEEEADFTDSQKLESKSTNEKDQISGQCDDAQHLMRPEDLALNIDSN